MCFDKKNLLLNRKQKIKLGSGLHINSKEMETWYMVSTFGTMAVCRREDDIKE